MWRIVRSKIVTVPSVFILTCVLFVYLENYKRIVINMNKILAIIATNLKYQINSSQHGIKSIGIKFNKLSTASNSIANLGN